MNHVSHSFGFEDIKIRGRHYRVTTNPRGSITITDILDRLRERTVFVEMEPEVRERLSHDPKAWGQEMTRLKTEAILKARKRFQR